MRANFEASTHKTTARHPFAMTALVLQGGGALGAYQAGVYEGLSEAGIAPEWVAGISIGAINAALIVGNPPERRIERLRQFWERVTSRFAWPMPDWGDQPRRVFNRLSAAASLIGGQRGFFEPRFPPAFLRMHGAPGATSVYDTRALCDTLVELVDFDLINRGPGRLSVGAVNIRTGNFVYFDSATRRIRPEHIMASGALPPGLPPVLVDGEPYWDGGLVSNTPLTHVLESGPKQDTLVFQVDLFSSRGPLPGDLFEAEQRRKHIAYRAGRASIPITTGECTPSSARSSSSMSTLRRSCDSRSGCRPCATWARATRSPSSISSTARGATSWNRATTSSRASLWGSTGRPASTTRGER
jgi:predicted acylesterase/phospholipase RssA